MIGEIVHLQPPPANYQPTARCCPRCRLARRAGFMAARVGALIVPLDEAQPHISWPLVCLTCGYEDEFGLVANPVPALYQRSD